MTAFDIKVIAIVTMLIDHIGLAFFFPLSPAYILFRLIGRLSFALFAFLIANGAYYTKNMKKYLIRLFIFAFVSQFPYLFFHQQRDPSFFRLNIFFTLFIGLLTIAIIMRTKKKLIRGFIIISAVFAAELLQCEYGAVGVLTILIFYFYFHNIRMMFLTLLPLFLITYTVPIVSMYVKNGFVWTDPVWIMQPLAIVSFLFILMYNRKEGPKLKYFFYLFYPFHLFVISMIKLFL
ncbi:MAG: hypothetical protein HYT11_03940 [Candidatus Levybacteria bacterium]|nr:hypothetical protein [Candidatus Levybacteria bacterium]